MSTHVPGQQYLYVASPGGEEDAKPSKIGISVDPPKRMSYIRRVYQQSDLITPSIPEQPAFDIVRIYDSKKDANIIERSLARALREYTLPRPREIFEITATELIELIEEAATCTTVEMDRF